MIVFKSWCKPMWKHSQTAFYHYEGWFLFGIIPLYVIRNGTKG